jgi:hypothetical protein
MKKLENVSGFAGIKEYRVKNAHNGGCGEHPHWLILFESRRTWQI